MTPSDSESTVEFDGPVISHPVESGDDVRLVDHGRAVACRALRLGEVDGEDPNGETPSDAAVVRCLALLHDFGKSVPAFQQYVRSEYGGETRRHTFHARIGAFATYHALQTAGASPRDCLAGWLAIAKHHGRLPDTTSYLDRVVKSEHRAHKIASTNGGDRPPNDAWVRPQIQMIDRHDSAAAVADELLREASGGATGWNSFATAYLDGSLLESIIEQTGEIALDGPRIDTEQLPQRTYDRTLRLWSLLTLADKSDAAGISTERLLAESMELGSLEKYLDTQHDGAVGTLDANLGVDPTNEQSLNRLREACRQRVRRNVPDLLDADIGTITLPTGLGKTFTGITAAFELRDRIATALNRSEKPTVVYALPYTSIIEQTRELFEDEEIFAADPTGPAFTVHHYLSETVRFDDSEGGHSDATGEAETDQHTPPAALLGESWRSGTVLTTFVQLFESLGGPSNAEGMKLPALGDAVVVLDEPQALPKRWWPAVRRLTETLVETFDARIISMTATQPTLFATDRLATTSMLTDGTEEDRDPELQRRISTAAARVRYRIDESIGAIDPATDATPVSHGEAGSRLFETATGDEDSDAGSHPAPDHEAGSRNTERSGMSVLAVCNTIASSRELTDAVQQAAREAGYAPAHIGDAYREALDATDDGAAAGSGTDESALVDPDDVAERTLRAIGLERVDGDWRAASVDENMLLVGTFNSRYRPLDRRALVRIADGLTGTAVPFVFVSTQAIEAGVDISFGAAFRDIAPLDSIVQTAGRCNRSFERGREAGEVTVWWLNEVDEEEEPPEDAADRVEGTPASYIYGEVNHLSKIVELLQSAAGGVADEGGTADSEDIWLPATVLEQEAVPEYFEWVEVSDTFTDPSLVQHIEDAQAHELGRESLINETYDTVDVLVAVTDADRQRLDRLADLLGSYPSEGYRYLNELSDLRVSVPTSDAEEFLRHHTRADRSGWSDRDGLDVLAHRGTEAYGEYGLDDGGFTTDSGDDGLSGRFTVT